MASTSDVDLRLPVFNINTQGVALEDQRAIAKQLLREENDEDWANLLSAAPRTLSSIGYCFAAAWSSNADNITQVKDDTIQKYLRSNLVDCSDLGRAAFREAESKMHQVSLTIQAITEPKGTICEILDAIELALKKGAADESTDSKLTEKLHDLEQYANDCTKDSASVVEKFTKWQELTTKINSAYTEANEKEQEDREKISKDIEELKNQPKDPENNAEESRLHRHFDFRRFFKRKKAERSSKQEHKTENSKVSEKLQHLSSKGATKDEVIDILQQCLYNLTNLKGDIEDLHSFFRQLHQEIENINTTRAPRFIKLAVQSVDGAPATDPDEQNKRIQKLRREVLRLSAYYARAGEKSTTYVQVSRKHIMPGVHKVNGLNKLDKDAIHEKVKVIAEYSEKAEAEIRKLALEGQQHRQLQMMELGQTSG